jgi:hypothetical protein
MEYCRGGELFHRMGKRHYSERTVSRRHITVVTVRVGSQHTPAVTVGSQGTSSTAALASTTSSCLSRDACGTTASARWADVITLRVAVITPAVP